LNVDVLSNTNYSLFSSNSSPLAIPIIFIFRRRCIHYDYIEGQSLIAGTQKQVNR